MAVKQMDDAVSISSSIDDRPRCRICSDNQGIMVSPCDCNGSIAFVHGICLDRWITVQKHSKCPVCSSNYSKILRLKPMRQWRRPRIVACKSAFKVYFSCLWLFGLLPLTLTMFMANCIIRNQKLEVDDIAVESTVDKLKVSPSFGLSALAFIASFAVAALFALNTISATITLHHTFQQWRMDNAQFVWMTKKKKKKVLTQNSVV